MENTCKHCGKDIVLYSQKVPKVEYWIHCYQYGIKPYCWNDDFTRRETVAEPNDSNQT
jgi:hypothetical protein